jgi:hypothetical protein
MSLAFSESSASVRKCPPQSLKHKFILNRNIENLKSNGDYEISNQWNYGEYGTRSNDSSITSVDNRFNYKEKHSECDQFETSFTKSPPKKLIAPCANIFNLDKDAKALINPMSLQSHHGPDNCEKFYTCNETKKSFTEGCILSNYQDTYIAETTYVGHESLEEINHKPKS